MTDDDFYGKYAGFVRDASDPDGRGRLRLYVPEVLGSIDDTDHWTDWALPCLPWFAHLGVGNALVPQKDGGWGVWVEFRHGAPRFPIWVGVFPIAGTRLNTTKLEFDSGGTCQLDGSKIFLGGEIDPLAIPPGPSSAALVLGSGIDPFTNAPYSALGGCSTVVFAKKV